MPLYIPLVFILTTALTLFFLYRSFNQSLAFLGIILGWLILQALAALSGFYLNTASTPPRLLFLLGPPMLAIVIMLSTKRGRQFIDTANLRFLTWLHVIRIPVELTLLGLFLHKQIPQLMTFEGRNFDILSGITAPLVVWLVHTLPSINNNEPAHQKKTARYRKMIIAWNFICLGLLLNIVINAVLSAPTPFQQFAFDQPNIAILQFPYVWLPGLLVPALLFSHLIVIRRLWKA